MLTLLRGRNKRNVFLPGTRAGILDLRLGGSVFFLVLALVIVWPAEASEPQLKELRPRGAQRGKTFTLTLKGEGLVPGAEVLTTLPCTISRLAPKKDLETPDSELPFLVQVPEEAPVGLYPIRVRTPDGLTNVLLFSVGDLPEISEKEPNDSLAEAQPISIPVTVTGTLKGADKDFYRFWAKAHERLVLEVEARRAGSAIDPVVEVFDSTGRRIAFNDDAPGLGVDARVDVTFPKSAYYYVLVHDSKYSEQTENFYRLKVGSYVYAEGIFPLGWQRGKPVEVTFFGGNLEKPVKVRPNLSVSPETQTIPINLPGPKPIGGLPFQFLVSDRPEMLEPEEGAVKPLELSTVVNGRISRGGEIDRYRLKVSPGQKYLIDLVAASLGTSELVASLTVEDSQGNRLAASDLGSAGPGRHGALVGEGVDPKLAFTVPDKVEEVILAVKDVRGLGGLAYAYRLLATPEPEDFSLELISPYVNVPAQGTAAIEVVAERHGYDGPIQLSIPELPDDFLVAGGNVAAEILNYEGKRERNTIGYLTLTAKPGAKPRACQLSVWGEGGPADHPLRRRAEGPGLIVYVKEEPVLNLTGDPLPQKPFTAPWLGMQLTVAIKKALPVTLEVATRSVRLVQGMDSPIEWKLVKHGPGIVPKEVSGLPLPTIKDLSLSETPEFKGKDTGKLVLSSTLDTPLVKFDAVPTATLQINGKEERVVAPAITVELVRAYSLALASDRMELKNGGKVELAGTIHREPGFPGTVKIKVGDPPDRVTCPAVEVPNDKSEFQLTCEAAGDAGGGDFVVHLVSSATIPGGKDNREFKIPLIMAHMVLRGEKQAETATNSPR